LGKPTYYLDLISLSLFADAGEVAKVRGKLELALPFSSWVLGMFFLFFLKLPYRQNTGTLDTFVTWVWCVEIRTDEWDEMS
jgi:hypothetical protein